ncbi:MAG: ABC transporter permease [Rhodothermales bacterium]
MLFDLDAALAAWRRTFAHRRVISRRDLDEMERHLRDQVDFLVTHGTPPAEAFRAAVQEMGTWDEAEAAYRAVYFDKLKHNHTLGRELGWYTQMIQTYFKTALRTLRKNAVPASINLFGLSVAIACSIVVYIWVESAWSANDFHEQGESLYLVEHSIERNGELQMWGTSPAPLGPQLVATLPQVTEAIRVMRSYAAVTANGQTFDDGLTIVDPAFLEMFTFPLAYGQLAALYDPNAVVLSHATATRFFGELDVVGREVVVAVGDVQHAFTVRGVAEPLPSNRTFGFSLLLPVTAAEAFGLHVLDDWGDLISGTFIRVQPGTDLEALAEAIQPYIEPEQLANPDWPIQSFRLNNVAEPLPGSYAVTRSLISPEHPASIIVLVALGVMLLALSCLNYVNIALAMAAKRIKEIGIRKVVGGSRRQLIAQFLTENVVLCVFALVVGVVIASVYLVPAFNSFDGDAQSVSLLGDGRLLVFLLVLLVSVGLISGAYPAMYLSSLRPIVIFRQRAFRQGRAWLMRSFLTVQFVLAFCIVMLSVALAMNNSYQREQDWGYERDGVLVVPLAESEHQALLEATLEQQPYIERMAATAHVIGLAEDDVVVTVGVEQVDADRFAVDADYLELMGVRLMAGRLFDPALHTAVNSSLVVNQQFIEARQWTAEAALGQPVRFDTSTYTIVGVVADFHYDHFSSDIRPAIFHIADPGIYNYLAVRFQDGFEAEAEAATEAAWTALVPHKTYHAFLQNTVFDGYFSQNRSVTGIFGFVAVLAMLIACLGLFGLASQHLASRLREVGIRKVVGASSRQVMQQINKGFIWMLAAAFVIATPLSYLALSAFFDVAFSYHMPLGPLPFLVGYAVVALTVGSTFISQLYQIAKSDPAVILRSE